jgi:hypothetical protein
MTPADPLRERCQAIRFRMRKASTQRGTDPLDVLVAFVQAERHAEAVAIKQWAEAQGRHGPLIEYIEQRIAEGGVSG